MNPLFHILFQQNRYLVNQLNDVLKNHGLFNSQWTILFLLHENGPMSLTSIWKYLNVEAPTITRTVSRLEVLGWVERQQGIDKREKIITLTPYANEQFPTVEASVLAFEQQMIQNLNNEDQQLLIHLLKKMKG
ncbi:MarR family transcriptional regulator [Lysinibacillus sp. 2017]|uniref:MarR family winged helix-turn-helix transcriptional regulator n=1 Tax=unclassified Lysinibacillus TaxID=2636778 RepID=UPI000D527EB9|nr:MULTISPECIES: MarR family transcriptional regulator [unclassified Lysinibacillus]AWE07067.1 MarR family transcriptional regulator [Lysinibacillus sp. 2017]TGN37013.1 MarR family transcriptional regulator [Lysinibacillus sp. S2017]